MKRTIVSIVTLCFALTVAAVAQRPSASPAEIKQAEHDIPKLIDLLGLKPGMAVADVGAGFGAMMTVLAKQLGPNSRIYATDVAAPQLAALREAIAREHLENVIVLEGSDRSTNLPAACCDAIYIRDVYHHFTQPADINRSLFAALKAGGRLAVIDFEPRPGSPVPDGVAANRGGHGIPPQIVADEATQAGFAVDRTIPRWPEDEGGYFLVLLRKP